jgi:cytochrome c-type biogenesis protein CcsB
VPVDVTLAHRSDTLLFLAVVVYSLAMLGFAAEFSFSRRAGIARALSRAELRAARRPVAVGASSAGAAATADRGPMPTAPSGTDLDTSGDHLGRIAVLLTGVGFLLHAGSVVTRGMAAHRVPWGNMYEYSSMVALVATGAFLVLLTRERVRYLGAFVLLFVVLFLGLAGTVLYVPAGPLIPALQSYWIDIHVAAAITASGTFALGGIVTLLYLMREAYERLTAAGRPTRISSLGRLLPPASSLDRVAYRVHAFAFPLWTFAVIAGAIWAESAWGRYWGWDPKETWSFITWVVYAGYLHARATAGWRGRKAAIIALVGFSALTIDYYVVNIFLVGLHSYAGV